MQQIGEKIKDDFVWDTYTKDHYEREMIEVIQKRDNQDMIVNKFSEVNGEIVFHDNLHNNWKEIYHLVHKLGVKSVFECGCGCAHHLININKITPNVEINGCDYAQSQIDLGYKYFDLHKYGFAKRLTVTDMVDGENIGSMGTHEFVYTQAVTMHLRLVKAKKFLYNMKKLSSKYVFLIENITAHNYESLIPEIFPEFDRVMDGKYLDTGILLKRKDEKK